MTTTRSPLYTHYRFPADIITCAVWLHLRVPLTPHMLGAMLSARDFAVTHERFWRSA